MDIYKADLHIHTPKSQCYLGPKNDDSYFNILKKAKEQGISIIAITDHNSIAGYDSLMKLRDANTCELAFAQKYSKDNQVMMDVCARCEEIEGLFNDILILPGVELTINPGIHILIIAEHSDLEDLNSILKLVGYGEDNYGCDDFITTMDIAQLLELSQLQNKLGRVDTKLQMMYNSPYEDNKCAI